MTYNYSTGQIDRDFVFKKIEGSCDKDQSRTALIGVFCRTCPAYKGEKNGFVLCTHHKEDDKGSEELRRWMYDKFREEAISHFYD